MLALNLPTFDHKTKHVEGKVYIFDSLRRKYVRLSPEEWVRQHIVNLLLTHFAYPKALIRTEGGLELNQTQKRTDVVVFDREGRPFLVVECKAPHVTITQQVIDQVTRYNYIHRAPYLVLSNGLVHYCYSVNHDTSEIKFMDDFPAFT
ncbi:type I restriction enzyme HsdR N-terminal domain-containing protein [Spirosoma sp. BT702]|uniref:Type I restriction enzyme HsdR N-terminal domain-containing protein n=1 Tax=Spirosoma profusum TaxID=2771354 RepID=A0A927AQM6_9BACT|nr:type I restriction enzyme HsdR N-terminal domain-containing protein [Spirosoma profusum]MBD2700843.1 type I restriction enzyme HsdR N-terminal domain-containing protein [Spirosoma profusum]